MNQTRWRQIENLYFAALEKAPAERAAFLDAECANDADLRAEVESLLAAEQEASDVLPATDFELGMRLLAEPRYALRPGQDFGDYKILKFVGRGGMGEVYLARDERLGRQVALKLLPRDLMTDSDRVRRFRREARAASQIAHQNVAQIYEAGAASDAVGGHHFIAMEFVDGATLRALLKQPLAPAEAVTIAEQIAAALEAAAEVGVVHRDLKPENVMLRRRDGQVKVLDFGLAKFVGTRNAERGTRNEEIEASIQLPDRKNPQSAIRNPQFTNPGLLMGTATYMSPEQARAQSVDHRGDLWSLGVILYEMLTGRPPFAGETKSDIIAAVLRGEHEPLATRRPELPPEAERIVARALQKNRAARYQTASELAEDLRRLRRLLDSPPAPPDAARSAANQTAPQLKISDRNLNKLTESANSDDGGRSDAADSSAAKSRASSGLESFTTKIKSRRLVVTAILLLIITGAAAWRIAQLNTTSPAAAPFSIAARENLRISTLFDTKRKAGGSIRGLNFSPDGAALAFALTGEGKSAIYVKRIGDGALVKMTDGKWIDGYPVWSADGERLAFVSNRENKTALWSVAYPSGGEPVLLRTLDFPPGSPLQLKKWSGDGRRIYFERQSNLYALDLEGGQTKTISSPEYQNSSSEFSISPDERMFAFLSSRDEEMNIYVQPMDDGGGGAAKQITRSKTDQWSPAWFPDNRHLAYSSDQNGIYQIYVVNIESGEATQITFGDADSEYPVVSPDGSQIAFVSEKNEANIFSLDLNDQTETAQTSNVNLQLFPDISPDGRRLAFHTTRSRLFSSELKIKSLDAPLDEPTVVAKGGHARLSPDGRTLAFVRFDDKALNIWRVDADGRNEKRLTGEGILPGAYAEIPYEFFTTYFSWSPDGGRIAYVSTKSGQPNVWTIAADGADARQLTDNADANLQINSPLWSPDGSRVAFAARTRAQTAADKPQNRVYAVENGQSKIVWQTDSQIRLLGWSATGAEIFVAAKEAEEIAVFKIPVGEGEKKTIRPAARLPGASLHAVRLSPDRRQLAFVARNGDGRDNIFQVSAEPGGGEIRQLTANLDPTLYYSGLAWSPDGRKLFYSKQTGGLQISLITNPK